MQTLNAELKTKHLAQISRTSLHRVLPTIGFKFKKESNRRALVEKTNIAAMRGHFMRKYIENLKSPLSREVIFLDETWIYSKGSARKSWQDDDVKSVRKPEGYDGKRYIILHAGSSNGFVNNASLVFASKTKTGDYHGEMNGDLFFKWVKEKLVCNLEEPSLIVMDNAPYHSVLMEKEPSSSWNTPALVKWLNDNSVPFEENMSKKELLQLAKANKKQKKYVVDEYLREHGHEVLRLAPYHCEFNAIELIWAKAKTYYNKNIGRKGNGDQQVLDMWEKALNSVTTEVWKNCVRHTNALITKWYERERFIEEVEPLIIHVTQDSSSDSDDSLSE